MEGRGHMITMREVTKKWNSPVKQGDTKEKIKGGKSSQGRRVGIGRPPCKMEQKRSKDIIQLR